MTATFFNYGTNNSGFFCQYDTPSKVIENITKKELMAIADLRHNVLTKKEFYEVLSTDNNGKKKQEFTLLGSYFLIVVTL